MNPGLYIIPTPIGNLEDITIRSLEALKSMDFILCEDTRTSSKLLQRYDIRKSLYPFHQFNEHRSVSYYTERIEKGECAGLISDSGTPAISDPGFLIVRHCIEHNIPVMTLPGAVAFIPALVSSGLPCDRFCFEGFLPPKKGRNKKLQALQDESRTMVFYESPYRLVKTLLQFAEVFGEERRACVSREISKIHEEHRRGTLQELCQHYATIKPKGEIVLIVEGLLRK